MCLSYCIQFSEDPTRNGSSILGHLLGMVNDRRQRSICRKLCFSQHAEPVYSDFRVIYPDGDATNKQAW